MWNLASWCTMEVCLRYTIQTGGRWDQQAFWGAQDILARLSQTREAVWLSDDTDLRDPRSALVLQRLVPAFARLPSLCRGRYSCHQECPLRNPHYRPQKRRAYPKTVKEIKGRFKGWLFQKGFLFLLKPLLRKKSKTDNSTVNTNTLYLDYKNVFDTKLVFLVFIPQLYV